MSLILVFSNNIFHTALTCFYIKLQNVQFKRAIKKWYFSSLITSQKNEMFSQFLHTALNTVKWKPVCTLECVAHSCKNCHEAAIKAQQELNHYTHWALNDSNAVCNHRIWGNSSVWEKWNGCLYHNVRREICIQKSKRERQTEPFVCVAVQRVIYPERRSRVQQHNSFPGDWEAAESTTGRQMFRRRPAPSWRRQQ